MQHTNVSTDEIEIFFRKTGVADDMAESSGDGGGGGSDDMGLETVARRLHTPRRGDNGARFLRQELRQQRQRGQHYRADCRGQRLVVQQDYARWMRGGAEARSRGDGERGAHSLRDHQLADDAPRGNTRRGGQFELPQRTAAVGGHGVQGDRAETHRRRQGLGLRTAMRWTECHGWRHGGQGVGADTRHRQRNNR